MTEFDVLCVGVATLDRIVVVDTLPGDDERIVAEPFTVAGGGPAATAAVALARLGARVALCAVVGPDDAGRQVLEGLRAEGVNLRWVSVRDDVRTTESVVLVNRHRETRTIITTPSSPPAVSSVALDLAPWVHVDQTGYGAVREAMLLSPGPLPKLSVDAGNGIDDLDLAGIALYAPTVGQLRGRFPGSLPESLSAARSAGADAVVATAGSGGCYVLKGDEIIHIPVAATDAVSTVGAGDVFHGALLAATVAGAGLVEAARFAAATAALSCRALDGRSAIPYAEDLRDRFGVEVGTQRQQLDGVAKSDNGRRRHP